MMRRMLGKIVGGAALLGVAFASLGPSPVKAQTSYQTQFVTAVTYQNVGNAAASIQFNFYQAGSATPITINLPALPVNAGTSLAVGTRTDIPAGFEGAGVLVSDQPVVATLVQIATPNTSAVRNRPLSNGFSPGEASAQFQIPTVLKNAFNQVTRFAIQNVDQAAANIEVRFVSADPSNLGTVVHTLAISNLPAGSVRYVDAGTISQLGTTFNGSAQITATRTTGGAGQIVASALEFSTNGTGVSSFEGSAGGATGGANTVYMPSALCNAFGGQQTAYAVQNVDTPGATGAQAAAVTVTYRAQPANNASAPIETFTFNVNIPAGAKASIAGCTSNLPAGYNGSATLVSTGARIVAVGKVVGSGSTRGITSASPGLTSGSSELALPYVRWSQSQYVPGGRQRTAIAIQNIGSANLAAGAVKVQYYDKNGTLLAEHSLPAIARNAKVNSNPNIVGLGEFGYYDDNTFGGSAVIVGPSGSQLVGLARVLSQTATGEVGEDYNAVPVQ